MSLITTLTRIWLLRSFRPFVFQPDNGESVPSLAGTERPGLYVHIPFCRSICHFCPYCKVLFDERLCETYIQALLNEISLFAAPLAGRTPCSSLYFGGGSPALACERLHEIISALRRHFDITDGIGIELHPDDVSIPVLSALKDAGVTRLSIGVQTFNEERQQWLGRQQIDLASMKAALAAVPFETVSMDFIFALPGQTANELMQDINQAFDIGANHIAIYPFIQFTFNEKRFPPMPNAEKRRLLDDVTNRLNALGCHRDSIWTFAKDQACRYSSMTRDNYLGFGCSATTLLRTQFRINTFSVEEYCRRINAGHLPTALTLDFTQRQRMLYWLFWKAYTTRLPLNEFEQFFNVPLKRVFGTEIKLAKCTGLATEENGILKLTQKGAFYFHYYENFYTLAYIDKMWGLMRHEPFPKQFTL